MNIPRGYQASAILSSGQVASLFRWSIMYMAAAWAPHACSPRRPALGCQSTAAPQHSHTAIRSALALPLPPHPQKETTQKLCADVKRETVHELL